MTLREKIIKLVTVLRKTDYIKLAKELVFFGRFFGLVVLFLFFDVLRMIGHLWPIKYLVGPFKSPVKAIRKKAFALFNSKADGEISSLDLISLAVSHLKAKKTRTLITIGGMSIGFGAVIFLLSLGYGTQKLVISRVARLEEMRQINVTVGQASTLRLNDETLNNFKGIEHVTAVLPMVSTVSKVNYNNSVSDVVVYGVSKEFLKESAVQPSSGKLFEDGEQAVVSQVVAQVGQVAGASIELRTDAKLYKELAQLSYSIYPLVWKAVYAEPSKEAEVIGYTSRVAGEQQATEVWGKQYQNSIDSPEGIDLYDNHFTAWIKDSFPLWQVETCDKETIDCFDGNYVLIRDGGAQKQAVGFITEDDVSLTRFEVIPESKTVLAEGELVDQIQFTFGSNNYVQVYSDYRKDAELLNLFTKQRNQNEIYSGELVFGEKYISSSGWGNVGTNEHGQQVGLWVKAKLPLWRQVDCKDCVDVYLTETDNQDDQVETLALVKAADVLIEQLPTPPSFGQVLGDSIDLTATDASSSTDSIGSGEIDLGNGSVLAARPAEDGSVEWVTIASGSAEVSNDQRSLVEFAETAQKQVVVNSAMLNILGIVESEALNKTFNATVLLDQEFFATPDYQAESKPTDFTIIGVIPGDKNAAYYLPFNDIKGLGIDNYSQFKVVVDNQDNLPAIRQEIEGSGFKTNSVVDTVGKINSLFDTIRLLLSLLGFVALGVASLGMFNTLTVSLLEKTREVGLMKAIGMKSNEVKRLFLAESIVMGLSGGIFGLVISTLLGYLLSFGLSMLSITKGLGYINLVYTPVYLALSIIVVSFFVGVATGMYPSHRATKISALNALRYE